MDVLKKMFSNNARNPEADAPKDEFRKPSWIDVSDTDDELFDGKKSKFLFQVFTNPIELQKHFDNQMQQVLKSMKELEDSGDIYDLPTKDDYLKPGFDDHFMEQFRKSSISDTDLDGEIYAEQLHSLLQRIQPEVKEKIDKKTQQFVGLNTEKPRLTDEQKIFGRIHGSIVDEEKDKPVVVRKKDVMIPRMPPHFGGGVFEGAYQGPKMFGQSIINQTIRKPDGSIEAKQIVRDSTGNVKTTITRTNKDGKTETVTSFGKPGADGMVRASKMPVDDGDTGIGYWMDKNIFVNKNGYALPMNLW